MNMSVVTEGDLGFVVCFHAHCPQPMCLFTRYPYLPKYY